MAAEVAVLQTRALIAQLVEHLICNQGVAGSNPAGGTNQINKFAMNFGSLFSVGEHRASTVTIYAHTLRPESGRTLGQSPSPE